MMHETDMLESIDIDTQDDWDLAEVIKKYYQIRNYPNDL